MIYLTGEELNEFHQNCIWYVESSSKNAEDKIRMGSAVAIQLKCKADGKKKTHLLTCQHVVRKEIDSLDKLGRGAVHDKIRAWQPNHDFNEENPIKVTVNRDIKPFSGFDPSSELPDSINIRDWMENDWIVLSFDVEPTCTVLKEWGEAKQNTKVNVVGYPNGKESFIKNDPRKVVPTLVGPIRVHRVAKKSETPNSLDLTSTDTRGGMSGGGVFNNQSVTLVAIHRSKNDGTTTLRGIPIKHIANVIAKQGYIIVRNQTMATFVFLLSLVVLLAMMILVFS